MSQIPVEKKLELIRTIRSEQHQNKELLRSREALLYGKSLSPGSLEPISYHYESHTKTQTPAGPAISGFKIRLFAATLFLGIVFCLELFQVKSLKEPLNALYTEISKDGNLFDFVEDLTYTLKDD